MNMQAMLKQAQKLQKDMMSAKEEIDNKIFEAKSGKVSIKSKGTKEVTSVEIDADSLDKEEIEMIQDMFLVAVNDVNKKIDKETEEKLGKYTQGLPGGLF